MSYASLSNTFTVNQVPVEVDTDAFLNILRRREKFAFRSRVADSSVGISYVGNEAISSEKTLFVADKSSDLTSNRIENITQYLVVPNIMAYDIETTNFLVTDVFTTETSTIQNIPLFFNHIISTINVPRVSDTNYTLNSVKLTNIQIVDRFFNPIKDPEIFIDTDKGIIYNNLLNSFDSVDGTTQTYYVQYSLRVGNQVINYIEILNNTNVYRLATFDDLTNLLTIIPDGRKVYLLEANTGSGYHITLPTTSTYAFKITATSKIQIISPVALDSKKPWLVEISNSTIFGNSYKYYLPEFSLQAWNPVFPTKQRIEEESTVIDKGLIKLDKQNIFEDSIGNLWLTLEINDKNNIGVAAFTNNPILIGTLASNGEVFVQWNSLNRKGIRSIDYKTGFIDLDGIQLKSNYNILTTYYFTESNYEFTLFDFNPINNPDILEQRVIIFLDPDLITGTPKSQTIYYLITDPTGKVIQSNWYNFLNNGETLLNGHPLFYDSIPSYLTYPTAELFVQNYTLRGIGPILILGELYIGENSSPKRSTYFDVRTPGGGIKENKIEELIAKNIEVSSFMDIGFFDGTPYPGNASYFIEVPVEVLEGAGGVFRSNQIKDIVMRHTAAGVYPIVKAYGIDPVIDTIIPAETSIEIGWKSFPEILYNVYYSLSAEGPWNVANTSLLSDNSDGNIFTITGLSNGVVYYFFVVGGRLDSEGIWIPSAGQPIGPNSSPAIGIINPNIKASKTFSPTTNTTSSIGNSFVVV